MLYCSMLLPCITAVAVVDSQDMESELDFSIQSRAGDMGEDG